VTSWSDAARRAASSPNICEVSCADALVTSMPSPAIQRGDRRRRALADSLEALLYLRVDDLAGVDRAFDGPLQHLVRAGEQRLTEGAELLARLLRWSGGRSGGANVAARGTGALSSHVNRDIGARRTRLYLVKIP
jgi:hypothetical protein